MEVVCTSNVLSFLSTAEPSHSHISVDGPCPLSTSPGVPHLRFTRRSSEASIASQASGQADSYTASNIATSKPPTSDLWLLIRLLACFVLTFSLGTFPQQTNVMCGPVRGPACCRSCRCPTISSSSGAQPLALASTSSGCSPDPRGRSLSRAQT